MFWKKKDEKKFSSIEVAICSLLIHAAKTDEDYQELEKQLIKDFLSSFTSKDKKYIEELFLHCEVVEDKSIEIHSMTKEIKAFEYNKRLEIIEILVKLIYSDERLCHYEDRLLRKVAGLIYIEDKDLGIIKRKIKDDLHS